MNKLDMTVLVLSMSFVAAIIVAVIFDVELSPLKALKVLF